MSSGLMQVVLELVAPAGDVGQSALETGVDKNPLQLSGQLLDLPVDVCQDASVRAAQGALIQP